MSKKNEAANSAPAVILNGSDSFPAEVELAESRTIPLGTLIAHAHTASGLSADDWNKLEAEQRDELLQKSIDALKADGAAEQQQPPPPPAGKKVKARVLVASVIAGEHRQPNDVITVDAATLKGNAGALDADPAAVKYAESLRGSAED